MFKRSKNKILSENIEAAKKEKSPKDDKLAKTNADKHFEAVRSFESDRVALAKNTAKVAWRFAGAEGVVIMLMAFAIAMMMPLKKITPYVIRVDNNTGYTDVVQPIGDAQTTYGQELDKYWLSQFVVNRESYEWQTIQNMYDTVGLMSDSKTFSQYKTIIENKEVSPLHLLKKEKELKARVLSITFVKDLAQVRFIKYVQNSDGSPAAEYKPAYFISTISYDYMKDIKTEQQRLINPLGFRVVSYRADPESVGGSKR
ncbi:type IV secretion system protein [Salmonella enterica]